MFSAWLRRRLRRGRPTPKHPPAGRFRPRLEVLEDRTVPTVSVNLVTDQPTVTFGQPFKLTATVASDAGALTAGDVLFQDGNTTLGDVPVPPGSASPFQAVLPTAPALTIGIHDLTAVYETTTGSLSLGGVPGNDGGSTPIIVGLPGGTGTPMSITSKDVTETVTPPPPPRPAGPSLAPSLFPSVRFQGSGSITVSAIVVGAAGVAPPTGLALFFVTRPGALGGSFVGAASVQQGVLNSFTDPIGVNLHKFGSYEIHVVYLGDATYLPAEDAVAVEGGFRTPVETAVTLTAEPLRFLGITYGVKLTAHVESPVPIPPGQAVRSLLDPSQVIAIAGNQVTFFEDRARVADGPVDIDGNVTLELTVPTAGGHQIKAAFMDPTGVFAKSESGSVTTEFIL